MAELAPDLQAFLQRMEAFVDDPSAQTLEAASAIYRDPLYRQLLKTQISNPTVAKFIARHIDLARPVAIQKLKDELARRQEPKQ